jgi:hypothetical protein
MSFEREVLDLPNGWVPSMQSAVCPHANALCGLFFNCIHMKILIDHLRTPEQRIDDAVELLRRVLEEVVGARQK